MTQSYMENKIFKSFIAAGVKAGGSIDERFTTRLNPHETQVFESAVHSLVARELIEDREDHRRHFILTQKGYKMLN